MRAGGCAPAPQLTANIAFLASWLPRPGCWSTNCFLGTTTATRELSSELPYTQICAGWGAGGDARMGQR